MLIVTARNAALGAAAIVNPTRFEYLEKWLDVGGWSLTVETDSEAAEALAVAGSGVIVVDETDTTICSGRTLRTDGNTTTAARREIRVDANGNYIDQTTFAGVDDLAWLRDRICLPQPTTATYAAYSDSRTGTASTVLLGYIADNSSTTGRALPYTYAADPAAGGSITTATRFGNLLDQAREVAMLGGLTFHAKQLADEMIFTVLAGRDLSSDVVFSPAAGNVESIVIDAAPTAATAVFVAGQGEGAARAIRLRSTGAADTERTEEFLDRRDLATTGELDAVGDIWLAENSGAPTIEFQPVDSPGAVFGTDYGVGDIVQLEAPGISAAYRIVSAQTSITPDEVTRTLTAGALAATGEQALLRSIIETRRRVAALEANY